VNGADPHWEETILLIQPRAGDAGAVDRTGRHRPTFNEYAALDGRGRWDGHAAIALDGYGDYVSVPISPELNLAGGAFTIEWMGRLNSVARTRCLMAHWTFLRWEASVFSLRVEQGVPALYVPSGEDMVRVAAAGPVAAGRPLYIAVTGDGAGGVQLWIDGVPAGAGLLAGPMNTCPSPLTIGVEGETEFYFDGQVDAVRITRGVARGIGPHTHPFPCG